MVRGQARQDDGRERDREHAHREFHQAVRAVEPGDAADHQEGRDDGVEQQRNLRDRGAEDARQHQAPDALHALPRAVEARARQEPDRVERGKLGNQLHDAGDEDADREHEARGREVRRDEPGRHDHDDVEQRLVERGHRESAVAVEDAAAERDQRDEEHVGKGEAQHRDRQVESSVAVVPARREQEGQHRRRDHADQGDGEQDEAEHAGDAGDQLADLGVRLLHLVLGDDRHEGLRERALGGQAAHEVRDLERHQEGVHQGPGAERDQVDHVPDHARDPGEERQEANDRGIAQESVRHAAGTIAR